MNKLISCAFHMDTACVELRHTDGSMISIDTIAVENEIADIAICSGVTSYATFLRRTFCTII